MPFILHEIDTQPRRQYLLLHSLKEVISAQSTSQSGVQVNKGGRGLCLSVSLYNILNLVAEYQPKPN